MYHTILVPLDGSYLSERALPMATVLARESGAQLVLVRAAWATVLPGVDPSEAQLLAVEEAEQYLMGIMRQLTGQGVRAQMSVPYATAAEGILLEIDRQHPDLVVMCTHGRSGVGRWFYGSVAEVVLAKSPVPVLLVRPTGTLGRLALESERPRVLVPLDGSTWAETALPYALDIARDFNATLVLCRVVVPLPAPNAEMLLATPYLAEDLLQEQRAEAEQYLAITAETLRQQGLRVQTSLRTEAAAEAILDEARHKGAALIVMATHGRTGLGRLLFGSVALGVLQHSQIPLLLVRPSGMMPLAFKPQAKAEQVAAPA